MMNITFKQNIKTTILGLVAGIAILSAGVVSADTYTCKKSGDTLSEIALTYNTTVEKLAEQNKITNPDFIHVGQAIELGEVIKVATSAQSAQETETATTAKQQQLALILQT